MASSATAIMEELIIDEYETDHDSELEREDMEEYYRYEESLVEKDQDEEPAQIVATGSGEYDVFYVKSFEKDEYNIPCAHPVCFIYDMRGFNLFWKNTFREIITTTKDKYYTAFDKKSKTHMYRFELWSSDESDPNRWIMKHNWRRRCADKINMQVLGDVKIFIKRNVKGVFCMRASLTIKQGILGNEFNSYFIDCGTLEKEDFTTYI